jgi:anti-sigma factor RsiW
MRCGTVRHLLNAYVNGQLKAAQRLRVLHHIARCDACHAALQRESAVTRQLQRQLPALGRPSTAQLARIWQGVKAHTRQVPPRRTDLRPASALITLTLVLACSAFIFRGGAVAAVAAPFQPIPAEVRATATPLFTETPERDSASLASPTASLTAVAERVPSAAPAPSARKKGQP